MKIFKIVLFIITLIFVGFSLFVFFVMKSNTPDPLFTYSNSEHSINYYFDLSKISVVLDKNSNVLKLVNSNNESVVILESEMDPSVFVNRGLTDWSKVESNNNQTLLVPPSQCKYFLVNTIINKDGTNTFVLADIINSWNPCKQ